MNRAGNLLNSVLINRLLSKLVIGGNPVRYLPKPTGVSLVGDWHGGKALLELQVKEVGSSEEGAGPWSRVKANKQQSETLGAAGF